MSISRSYRNDGSLSSIGQITRISNGSIADNIAWYFDTSSNLQTVLHHVYNADGSDDLKRWNLNADGSVKEVVQTDNQADGASQYYDWLYVSGKPYLANAEIVANTADGGTTDTSWTMTATGNFTGIFQTIDDAAHNETDTRWTYATDGTLASATRKAYDSNSHLLELDGWQYQGNLESQFSEWQYDTTGKLTHEFTVPYYTSNGPNTPASVTEQDYAVDGSLQSVWEWDYTNDGSAIYAITQYDSHLNPLVLWTVNVAGAAVAETQNILSANSWLALQYAWSFDVNGVATLGSAINYHPDFTQTEDLWPPFDTQHNRQLVNQVNLNPDDSIASQTVWFLQPTDNGQMQVLEVDVHAGNGSMTQQWVYNPDGTVNYSGPQSDGVPPAPAVPQRPAVTPPPLSLVPTFPDLPTMVPAAPSAPKAPQPPSDIPPVPLLKNLDWDPFDKGGIEFGYDAQGLPQGQAANIFLYWTTGTTASDRILAVKTVQNPQPENYLDAADLGPAPSGTKDLIMEVTTRNTAAGKVPTVNALPLEYDPQIETITGTYAIANDNTSLGRFFKGVPLPGGEVFKVTVNDTLAAMRPSKVQLQITGTRDDVGLSPLVLQPDFTNGWPDYVSVPFGSTAKNAIKSGIDTLEAQHYVLTAKATVGTAAPVTGKIGMDVVHLPTWDPVPAPPGMPAPQNNFDAGTKRYTLAVDLINVHSSDSAVFAMPNLIATWFAANAKTGLDAHIGWVVTTGLNPSMDPQITGSATVALTVLGQSVYSTQYTYPSANGPFNATVQFDDTTLNVKQALFTCKADTQKSGPLDLSYTSNDITKGPLKFNYELDATLNYQVALQLAIKKNGALDSSNSSIDFIVSTPTGQSDGLDGTLTVTDIAPLSPVFNKVLPVLSKAVGGVPGLLAGLVKDKLQDLGLLPQFQASAEVTGTLNLHGHAGLQNTLLNPNLAGPTLKGTTLTLTAPTINVGFTWLGDPYDLASIDLGHYLDVNVTIK